MLIRQIITFVGINLQVNQAKSLVSVGLTPDLQQFETSICQGEVRSSQYFEYNTYGCSRTNLLFHLDTQKIQILPLIDRYVFEVYTNFSNPIHMIRSSGKASVQRSFLAKRTIPTACC